METKVNVLDKGYVKLETNNVMGDDLSPVNDAKVSFDRESDEFGDKEGRLLDFLGREGHTSPFRHSFLKFEIHAPLMVARQWWKYVIGSDHAEQPLRNQDPHEAWNESSRRYVTESVEFYIVEADEWRSAPENRKQGSGEPLPLEQGEKLTEELIRNYEEGHRRYQEAIEAGVAVEQARLFLPAYGLYVRWRWAGSLQGVCHFLNQRLAGDAQSEIREYAEAVHTLSKQHFPNAIDALVRN
ncbi:FAD-dependent thymidylate synthase [Halobacillus ihumii]|uniref:FAD-dependent thymidylate synthase n=1 Tax=Halobacillus ihumii TaxID=2686092 RepID=UPI0013D4A706|nr:FAD-dependent thymidylate synthase [Halobacillus ihumii]